MENGSLSVLYHLIKTLPDAYAPQVDGLPENYPFGRLISICDKLATQGVHATQGLSVLIHRSLS